MLDQQAVRSGAPCDRMKLVQIGFLIAISVMLKGARLRWAMCRS
jgi:hypothetical protein